MNRLLYTCLTEAEGGFGWPELAQALRRDVEATCGDVEVEVGEGAVFARDATDDEETLLALAEQQPAARAVRLDLWCDVPCYGGVSVLLGAGLQRKEKRALARRLKKKSLRGETLLRTCEGAWDVDDGRVYGYRLDADDPADRPALEHLVMPFDPPLYLGEKWLLMDQKERVDEASFDQVIDAGTGLAFFFARRGEAEERVWQLARRGEGLIALYPDDPAQGEMVRYFKDPRRDLPLLVAEHPSHGSRVTLGRCLPEDSIAVHYGMVGEPEIQRPLLFMY